MQFNEDTTNLEFKSFKTIQLAVCIAFSRVVFSMCFHWQDQEEQAYFAVFDGHGGVDAAIYASIHLHVNMVHQEMFQHDPAEALCRAFRVTDERFVQKAAREVIELPGLGSGSINL